MKKHGTKNPYKKHLFSNVNEILNDLNQPKSIESKRMLATLFPIISKLQHDGILELENYALIFKDCGFNNKSINQIIIYLLDKLSKRSLANREINKLNNSYRNIIFNYLFHEYGNQIVKHIEEFISSFCHDIHNYDFLISKLNYHVQNKTLYEINYDPRINMTENIELFSISNEINDDNDEEGFDYDLYFDI